MAARRRQRPSSSPPLPPEHSPLPSVIVATARARTADPKIACDRSAAAKSPASGSTAAALPTAKLRRCSPPHHRIRRHRVPTATGPRCLPPLERAVVITTGAPKDGGSSSPEGGVTGREARASMDRQRRTRARTM
ncbi:Os01g0519000 [Oryza sativa Japonica Group]|uniref:Os01g0519000 protein n=1 Tax=Oryza sativa subsp. japonica TaxID=39947 RepID=A0A0P0V3B7_ORYSJ|nr:Os01g0519000 [Oryza sativa Japonica Group]